MRASPTRSETPDFVYLNQRRGQPLELGIFERLSATEQGMLRAAGRPLILKARHMLFRQGARHDGIFIIETGRVRTYFTSDRGRELTIAYWTPGNFVGGPELFGRGVHCWSGVATEPTQVVHLSGDQLCEILPDMPLFTMALLDGLVTKGRCMSSLLQLLGTKTARARLARALLDFGEFYGVACSEGVRVDLPYTHAEMAAMIGVTRQWITISLSKFAASGAIRMDGKAFIITDWQELQEFAQ